MSKIPSSNAAWMVLAFVAALVALVAIVAIVYGRGFRGEVNQHGAIMETRAIERNEP